MIPAVSLALLLVLAGCSGLGDTGASTDTATPETTVPDTDATDATDPTTEDTGTQTTESTTRTTDPSDDSDPEDSEEDVLGWEQGYWYNGSLSIDQSDGLNQSELDVVTARQMARVEVIRELEFTTDVSVEVITREEYEQRNTFDFNYGDWYEAYYEAAFLVDEETDVNDEFDTLYGSSVAGYYDPRSSAIVLVSDDPDEVRVDPTTLAHELVHALQDDALPRSPGATNLDDSTATTAVSEGDANYVMDRYVERCETEWDCIDDNSAGPGDRPDLNFGLYATVWLPYSDGPTLIESVRDRGGWEAVNDLYANPPESTEQVIHPEKYPEDDPVDVAIEDRSSADWEQLDRRGGSTGTFGEATLFATLWHNGVIDRDHVRSDDRRWNYSHPYTDGWGGDAVVSYSDGTDTGYVFKSVWDSEDDAAEFRDAYVQLLESKGAEAAGDGVYRIPDENGYGDAFYVSVEGNTVVVVNAPDTDSLDGIRKKR